MDLYTLLKYLHVAIAVAWLGAGLGAMLLAARAARSGNDTALVQAIGDSDFLASRIFMPGGMAVLVLGLILTWQRWSFADAWVLLALAGTIGTACIGGGILSPLARRTAAQGATAEGLAAARRLVRVHKGDVILLFTILWAMVAKPGWGNWIQIVLMFVAVALAWALFWKPEGRPLLPARPSA